MDTKKKLDKNETNKKKIVIAVMVIVLLCLLVGLYVVNMEPKDFSKQEGYEQLLENAIIEKNKEIQEEAKNSEYFTVPEEMEKDPKYRDSDGSLNMEMICEELGLSTEKPKGAKKEIEMIATNSAILPHVLGHAEAGIYYNENKEYWNLKKGDSIKFHVFVDTNYYGTVGELYFGALKNEETFLIDALDLDGGIKPDKEYEFKYTAPESGDYRFYLFRGSTEPIIIKWIYISRD
ncbi:MAG: hypothetical protein E7222_01695 [Clostridiales bacterium]|nr:hypothetical protein [Clostridiales bacterium]